MLTNNDILKKIKVALALKSADMSHIVTLGGYNPSNSEIRGILVSTTHKNFRRCSDELLTAFLEGLIIYMRDNRTS